MAEGYNILEIMRLKNKEYINMIEFDNIITDSICLTFIQYGKIAGIQRVCSEMR